MSCVFSLPRSYQQLDLVTRQYSTIKCGWYGQFFSLVLLHKCRKGDYLRYLAELGRGKAKEDYAISSLDAYKLAYKLALSTLDATHPTRLGLALNFSVYFRDVLNSPEKACHLAKHAFDEAIAELWKAALASCMSNLGSVRDFCWKECGTVNIPG